MNDNLASNAFYTLMQHDRKYLTLSELVALRGVSKALRRTVDAHGFKLKNLVDDLLFHPRFWRGFSQNAQQKFLLSFPSCSNNATTMHEALAYAIVCRNKEASETLLKFQQEFFSYLLGSLVHVPQRVVRLTYLCKKLSLTYVALTQLDMAEKSIFSYLSNSQADDFNFLQCVQQLRESQKYHENVCVALTVCIESSSAYRERKFSQKHERGFRNLIDVAFHTYNDVDQTFVGLNLEGVNFEGVNLTVANFAENAILRGANFGGANLEGACLWGANLEGANLEGANLSGAGLMGAHLKNANFTRANLQDSNLARCDFEGAIFDEVNCENCVVFCEKKPLRVEEYGRPANFPEPRPDAEERNTAVIRGFRADVAAGGTGLAILLFAISAKELVKLNNMQVVELKKVCKMCLTNCINKINSVEGLRKLFSLVKTLDNPFRYFISGNLFVNSTYPKVVELIAEAYVKLRQEDQHFKKQLITEINAVTGYFDRDWKILIGKVDAVKSNAGNSKSIINNNNAP